MGETVQIYVRLVGSRLRSQLQYRMSFALRFVGQFLVTAADFIAIAVIFAQLDLYAGWTLPEVAFLYGSSYIGARLGDLLVGHIEYLPRYIREGTFDTFLIRPLGSLFQVLTSDFSLRQVGGALQGAIVFAYAIGASGIDWTVGRAMMVVVMLVSGLAIFCGIWIATNCIAFWWIDSREVANAFTYGGNMLNQYPLHVFGAWFRRLMTYVIPVAFVNYYPALYILDKDSPLGFPSWLRFASPGVALLCLAAARLIWRASVREYRSTGS